MKTFLSLLCCLSAFLLAPASQAEALAAPVGEVVTIPVQPQAWQARRGEFARIINNLDSKDPATLQPFEAVLTEFEQQPFSRTPMENMEILGVYYLPREGIEAVLTYIAANAALGWYDALRYGSESGRSEILHNEGFFKLTFVLAGEDHAGLAVKFFEEQPEKTAYLVQQGIAIADTLKDAPRYDHQWPSAYGLERMMCAMGGECSPPSAMPQEQWSGAWEDAKARVVHYYRINTPPAGEPTSTPPKATPAKTKKR
jgi:hypothetical protein